MENPHESRVLLMGTAAHAGHSLEPGTDHTPLCHPHAAQGTVGREKTLECRSKADQNKGGVLMLVFCFSLPESIVTVIK